MRRVANKHVERAREAVLATVFCFGAIVVLCILFLYLWVSYTGFVLTDERSNGS